MLHKFDGRHGCGRRILRLVMVGGCSCSKVRVDEITPTEPGWPAPCWRSVKAIEEPQLVQLRRKLFIATIFVGFLLEEGASRLERGRGPAHAPVDKPKTTNPAPPPLALRSHKGVLRHQGTQHPLAAQPTTRLEHTHSTTHFIVFPPESAAGPRQRRVQFGAVQANAKHTNTGRR